MYKVKLIGKRVLEIVLLPMSWLSALWFRSVISEGIKFFPATRSMFMRVGILPVIDHYYYPLINPKKHLRHSLRDDRTLPGMFARCCSSILNWTPFVLDKKDKITR